MRSQGVGVDPALIASDLKSNALVIGLCNNLEDCNASCDLYPNCQECSRRFGGDFAGRTIPHGEIVLRLKIAAVAILRYCFWICSLPPSLLSLSLSHLSLSLASRSPKSLSVFPLSVFVCASISTQQVQLLPGFWGIFGAFKSWLSEVLNAFICITMGVTKTGAGSICALHCEHSAHSLPPSLSLSLSLSLYVSFSLSSIFTALDQFVAAYILAKHVTCPQAYNWSKIWGF